MTHDDEMPQVCALCDGTPCYFGLYLPPRTQMAQAIIYGICRNCWLKSGCLDQIEEKIMHETNVV